MVAALFFSACSNTKFLTGDQILYTGRGKVTIVNKEKIENENAALAVGKLLTEASPNNSILGKKRTLPPFGLWVHNYMKPKKEDAKPGWAYRNFASEPILVSHIDPEQRCKKIESELFAIGFFNAKATFLIDTNPRNPRKAKIDYNISLNNPFKINKIINATVVDSVDSIIKGYTNKLDVKTGDYFNVATIKSDKVKIASELTEKGYYFFGPNNIQFIGDTTEAPFEVNMMIGKNPETQDFICKKYTIDTIKVNLLGVDADSTDEANLPDTLIYNGVIITGLKGYLNPDVITRCIQFSKGDLYATSKHQATLRQLSNYGIFKYVKMQFVVKDSVNQKMNLIIEMSPKNDVSLNLEGFVQSKSTGFAGPGVETTLAHGNMNKQANKLQLKLNASFEWQWGLNNSETLGGNSYSAGINTSYVFPRLVVPFKLPSHSKLISTKTICNLGFDFTNNIQYYRMAGVNLSYSYQWKRTQKITNIFFPLKINNVNLLQTTNEFDSITNSNPYVKKSFEEQSVYGMEYNFIYDNNRRKRNGFYLQATFGAAGNLIDLIKSTQANERPYTVVGNVYSQFIKPSLEMRYFTKTMKQGLVFRFYSGVGFSYNNSTVMPYVEQFYSGGSNSLRGFIARSLGPGSYKPDESNGIIDQTGDIKLEFNVEYRFELSKMVLGALFVETGNVWLLNKDVNRPGAEFQFNTFTNQLAVGTGVGLRFDFDYFVLRTDFGLPLRNTYESDYGYWLSNANKVFSSTKLNIAIGYPF